MAEALGRGRDGQSVQLRTDESRTRCLGGVNKPASKAADRISPAQTLTQRTSRWASSQMTPSANSYPGGVAAEAVKVFIFLVLSRQRPDVLIDSDSD